MKPIRNPFIGSGDYACFACSPDHPAGLGMEFFLDGEEVACLWEPEERFEGYHGVLHGGIQSTLLDEIASWLIFVRLETAGVTSKLAVEFLRPVYIGRGRLRLTASLAETRGRAAIIQALLFDARGELCTRARVEYTLFSPRAAARKLAYPGLAAFLG
jgi:uncharacterized protein (TIGR00369 family)